MNAKSEDRARSFPTPQGVDVEAVLAIAGGDMRLLRDLLKTFLGEIPVLMRTIGEAIDRRDAGELQDAAHKLKGVVRYLHMDLASRQAHRLELLGEQSAGWEEAKGVFENLRSLVDDALRVLDDFIRERQHPG